MRNIWLVIKHEISTTISKPSFWLLTLLAPSLLLAVNVYSFLRASGAELELGSEVGEENPIPQEVVPAIGLVDQASQVGDIPQAIPSEMFLSFPDESAAREALDAEIIQQYVVVPADYLQAGELVLYDQNFQVVVDGQGMGVAFNSPYEWVLPYLMNYSLTGDENLVNLLRNPVPGSRARWHRLNPPEDTGPGPQVLAEMVAAVTPYVYYFVLVFGGSLLMKSVAAEKENRTAEVLLLSLQPRELMLGKTLGLSLVAFFQLALWFGAGFLVLNQGAQMFQLSAYAFPPGFLLWALVFFVFGFLLYASVMAAAGAIAPTAREANQVIWVLILPLMPTLMFGRLFFDEPDHHLAVILSLFPMSAPSAMVTRLAVAPVPAWQLGLSLFGLLVTTFLVVILAGRFFSSGNLLSNASFSWRRLATGWRRTEVVE